jgi:hypothetical protein
VFLAVVAAALLVVRNLFFSAELLNHTQVAVDPFSKELASGKQRDVFGLVLTSLWQTTPASLHVQYDRLRTRLMADDEISPYVYIYPYFALHCTVASLSKFTTGPLTRASLEVRETYVREWMHALDRAFVQCPARPGSLVFERPVLSTTAAILRIVDPLQSMASLRECVRAASTDAALSANGIDVSSETFSIPRIVHSSFMRFVDQPPSFEKFER